MHDIVILHIFRPCLWWIQNGWSALMCAASQGHAECLRLLVESGSNMDAMNEVWVWWRVSIAFVSAWQGSIFDIIVFVLIVSFNDQFVISLFFFNCVPTYWIDQFCDIIVFVLIVSFNDQFVISLFFFNCVPTYWIFKHSGRFNGIGVCRVQRSCTLRAWACEWWRRKRGQEQCSFF